MADNPLLVDVSSEIRRRAAIPISYGEAIVTPEVSGVIGTPAHTDDLTPGQGIPIIRGEYTLPAALAGIGAVSVQQTALTLLARSLLEIIGEDPDREGLRDTPARFARMWMEFIHYDPGTVDTTFPATAQTDQMVVVSGMRVWSLCEHHLLPFFADISIGYIARDRLLGLSKAARIAHARAHGLQVQERLCEEIATDLGTVLDTPDVAVLARGRHLCMEMRGIKTPALMTSSVMRGVFYDKPEARAEFLGLVQSDGCDRVR